MAKKPNYDFEKRKRELEKKRKKEEKQQRRRELSENPEAEASPDGTEGEPPAE